MPRGRPKFEPEMVEARRSAVSAQTTRSVQNLVYKNRALEALGIFNENGDRVEDHSFPNLNLASDKRGAIKDRVLIEIGRIAYRHGDEAALYAAREIEARYASGELKTVQEGEAMIRRVRLAWKQTGV
jgi:hypothetical protein